MVMEANRSIDPRLQSRTPLLLQPHHHSPAIGLPPSPQQHGPQIHFRPPTSMQQYRAYVQVLTASTNPMGGLIRLGMNGPLIGMEQNRPNVGMEQTRPITGMEQNRPNIGMEQNRIIGMEQNRPIIGMHHIYPGVPMWRPHPFPPCSPMHRFGATLPTQQLRFPSPFQPKGHPGMRMEFDTGAGMGYFNIGGVASQDPGGGRGTSSCSTNDPFIEEWLKRVEEYKPNHTHHEVKGCGSENIGVMKIPEVRSLLMKGVELLSRLRSAHHELTSAPLDDDTQWRISKMKVDQNKSEFLDIRSLLDKPALQEHLSLKASRLRKRRIRQNQSWKKRKRSWLERKEGLEKMTEDWVKEKEEENLKKKMEKSVQASAGGVLEEVKRKKVEVRHLLELAEASKELRTLRREANRKKGDAPPIEADEEFEENHTSLVDMLTRQSGVYEREEHALRVLMEEEVKEKIQTHHTNVARARSHNIDSASSVHASHMTSDPLEPYKRFYLQANDSREVMDAIRSDWDVFLCPEGSAVPTFPDMVAPLPSNLAWEKCLVVEKTQRTILE